ncbi:toluene tolerance family protein [Thioalkalivibrio sp. K90mix]|jgi:phospholipid transport system substrate-binding protein|uniref:MlaC/ttg2D family ABC transporter substrate-binding protein n=1 Tax=Thioalkalivibrio sp. (strain K90mix) TaxID=396595 RepID=UPI000195A7BA|nr:ABC transporter substrate-binding protein [Thioalkalivibrio sp. K90mix]ADC70898.1 toluene tolerance family protein [Thioalkalivibrio sp. K90mix]
MKTLRFWALPAPLWLLLLLALPGAAQADNPTEIIKQSIDEVYEKLRANEDRAQEDPDFVIGVIEDKILPGVDVEGMSRLVLARHWRDASSEQRERFTEAFKNTLLQAYGVQLADHLDKEIRVIERRSRQDDRMAVVATEIVMGSGQSNLQVNYRLRPVNGEWKVFDVEAEGLSFVGNFRNRFNEEINRNGLDALIERLEDGDRELVDDAMEGIADETSNNDG